MHYIVSILFLTLFTWLPGHAQRVTQNPKVDEASIPYVTITKVAVTAEHTAIYFRFVDKSVRSQTPQGVPPPFRDLFGQGAGSRIWIDPNTRLYKPGDIDTKFRFLKAEGIPTNPEQREVEAGEVLEFVTYFEPLPPGLEEFDFYEGRSTKSTTAWNFYGIHINNPAQPRPAPRKENIAAKPAEPVAAAPEKPVAGNFAGLTGTVKAAPTGLPVSAQILYLEDGDTVSVRTSSGKFRIGLTPGNVYDFQVVAKGYLPQTWHLNTADTTADGAFQKDFELTPLTEGTSFTLDKIYFETSQYTLLKESFEELDQFARMLAENPELRVRVEGHSDNIGDFDKNVELSRNRAESVRSYLIGKGISPDRIEAKGFGPTKPVSKGSSEAERKKNRRVEIVIVKT